MPPTRAEIARELGFKSANAAEEHLRALQKKGVLDLVPVLPFDLDVARVHGRIWADLSRRGAMIGAHDLIIAATAIRHDLAVLTRNQSEFSRVDGLDVRDLE